LHAELQREEREMKMYTEDNENYTLSRKKEKDAQ
jgi:hypothetical protein